MHVEAAVNDTVAVQSAPKTRSLPARIVGIVTSPRATYAEVVAQPRWFGVLFVVVLITAAGLFVFLSSEVGQRAALEQQVRTMESFGLTISDAQYARLERQAGFARFTGPIGQVIVLPILALLVSGLSIGVLNALGGDAGFKQVFAVVAHSGVIVALAQLFGLPLAYSRETLSSPVSSAPSICFRSGGS
jgi:hypothetical protein